MTIRAGATIPDSAVLLAEGVRAERAGALERALEAYRLAADSAPDAELRVEALTHQADVHRSRCEWERGLTAARQAQAIARDALLTEPLADAIVAEANILICLGDFATAVPKLEGLVSDSSEPRVRGIALQNLGSIRAESGDLTGAELAFTESLGNFHAAGYTRGEAIARNNLGRLALDSGDPANARTFLEGALGLARELQDSDLAALAGLNLAWALCAEGNLDRAQDLAMAALGYFADCNNRWREIECLRLIGDINERCENVDGAARCYECALRLAEQIGSQPEIRATRERLAALSRR